jgi:predicted GIY-YIG superfamily endonuclease
MADRTALYRLFDASGRLLYVGITGNPRVRWLQHASDKPWWPQATQRELEWLATRAEALAAEQQAITEERPLYNCSHALPTLAIEDHERLFADYKQAYEAERRMRPAVRAAGAHELRHGATVGQLAKLTGLTSEWFRRVARAEGIERLREPTVGRLKDGV